MPVSLSSTSKSLPSLIHSRKNARLTFRLSSNSSRFLLCALLVATFCLVQNDITFKKVVESHPRLSLYLGGNKCRWQPPNYEDPPLNITFHKTLVAGFPSGDKRLVFLQMEALTGLTAKDEWKFEDGGYTNHPFIKTNYPTHEGIWSWGNHTDQVMLVVRSIRTTLVEYHNILWDIDYAETYQEAFSRTENLFLERPPLDDWLAWRDLRVKDEIDWYGWFIDYWMEGGLMRDIFTHKITTPEQWNMVTKPTVYKKTDVAFDLIVGNDTDVEPSKDPHCINDLSDCRPSHIISGERLVTRESGPVEGRKIARALKGKQGISDYLINEEAWDCIWSELMVKKKGDKTFLDRKGIAESNYNFSEEMINAMIKELNRLIDKYGGGSQGEWSQESAKVLVSLLMSHRDLLYDEIEDVKEGRILLDNNDILGPDTRSRMFPTNR